MEGTQLSTYQIVSVLGSGGMGKVYRAEVTAKSAGLEPGTTVALKVIFPHLLATPGFFKRFLREAQIGQRVQHENVVRTLDCDATLQDGVQQNFLVMEYVEGQTLRDLLQELGRVPEELCRHVGREIAKGLAAIHGVGVVHRDIKPENVLITEDHVVKVMDLGIAHLQDEIIRLSRAGGFIGSLEYAAPEQIQSKGLQIDGRADLFALGALLYEIATGQQPFRDEEVRQVLRNVLDVDPRRPGEVNPQLSPFIEEVLTTLLAKDRENRFATATELAEVLAAGESSDWWKERAKALRLSTKKPLRRIRVPRETALYGRDDGLARLRGLFDEAKQGNGQVFLIEGEAGIGKTRLVDEFVARLREEGEDLNFLYGSYPPGGAATAAGAFATAYREQFGSIGLQETIAPYLEPTPLLVPAFAALLRGESTPTGEEGLTKDSLQTVFVHATRALAAERPTIVLIDDLHFAPEDGRALFAALALAAPGHRVLLIGTSRPGLPEDWMVNLERTGHASRMALSRLGPMHLIRLLEDAFRSKRLAEQLGVQVALKSDGNPFFAFEIIRGLREGQFITQLADGTWISTQVIRDIQIPSSVMDLIQARLQDLSEEERELLDVAACCGFEFDPDLVAEVVGTKPIPALRAFGRIENKHRLVRSTGRDFAFDHHQVQEALYAGQPERLREQYHAAIAETLEARSGAAGREPEALDGALVVDLCGHFLKGAQGERALRYLDAALEHLDAGYLHAERMALTERALQTPALLRGAARVGVLLAQEQALDRLGRRAAQGTVLYEAQSLAEAAGEPRLQALVRLAQGTLFSNTSRYEPALEELEAALSLARAATATRIEARALSQTGWTLQNLSRYKEATETLEAVLKLYRANDDPLGEATATGTLGTVLYRQGRIEEAIAANQRQLELAGKLGERALESMAAGNLGNVLHSQGRNEEARVAQERSLHVAHEIGNRPYEALVAGNLANTFSFDGLMSEALERDARARVMHHEVGNRRAEAIVLHNEGSIYGALGAPTEARVRYEEAISISREIRFPLVVTATLPLLADVLEELGDPEPAESLHRSALEDIAGIGARDEQAADAELRYGAMLVRVGRREEARPHLEQALSIATEASAAGPRLTALVRLALLDDGDPTEALAAFEAIQARLEHVKRMEANFLMHQLTRDRKYLETAHDLLMFLVDHAPEEFKQTTLTNVRLHRDIMAAWGEAAGS